jgi:predicted Fe-Mo cluster-binding NifX family protein
MKVAIESNDGGKTISDPFVRSKGFLIYEIDDRNIFFKEFRTTDKKNSAILDKELKDCNAIISRGMPSTFREKLEKQGKKVLITFSSSPRKALNAFLAHEINSKLIHQHS